MKIPAAIVFFDGGCSLCRREIDHYRRRRGADRLLWIDITQDDVMLSTHGLSQEQAMARFHVRDASGFWHTGAWGFVELWSHLPAYRWLASLLRKLRLVGLLDRFYSRFADWRLRRRCDPHSCHTGPPPEKRRDGSAAKRRTRA